MNKNSYIVLPIPLLYYYYTTTTTGMDHDLN